MNRKIFLTAAILVAAISMVQADQVVYKTTLVNQPALAYSTTYTLDLFSQNIDFLSMQSVVSTATMALQTFTDGAASTASITVVSTQPLVGVQGSDSATVLSTNSLTNAYFLLNGYIVSNIGWRVDVASDTAVDIASNLSNVTGFTASTTSANTVTVKCASVGTFCNSDTLSIVGTSSITVSSSKFSGGQNRAVLAIAGTPLTAGIDFPVGTTATTALGIAAAINANSVLSTIIIATAPTNSSVVYATSTAVGANTNYSIFSSTQSALKPLNYEFLGGTASSVLTSLGELNIGNYKFSQALPVLFTVTAGTSPQDLVANTTYYVVPLTISYPGAPNVDTNDFKLATTSAKAQALTSDVRLSTQTTLGGGSFKLTPLPFTGTASFKWQVANDNANWTDLTSANGVSVSSVTFASPYTPATSFWDFGEPQWHYLRLNVVGPTTGGLNLVLTGRGKTRYAK